MLRFSLGVLFGIGAIGLGVKSSIADSLIYDSGGFDLTTRFSPTFASMSEPSNLGNIRGQDGGSWFYSGDNTSTDAAATADIITTAEGPNYSPQQSVRVTRTTGNGAWAPVVNYAATGQTVRVTWTMDLPTVPSTPAAPTGLYGPFFGIDSVTSGNNLLGGAGIDASTGEFLYESPLIVPVNVNQATGFGTIIGAGYHSWELDYNFATQKYSALVDNVVEVANVPFLTTGSTIFSSANITTFPDVSSSAKDMGTVYFDDYKITAVPEPTSLMVFALSALSCGLRLRRVSL